VSRGKGGNAMMGSFLLTRGWKRGTGAESWEANGGGEDKKIYLKKTIENRLAPGLVGQVQKF